MHRVNQDLHTSTRIRCKHAPCAPRKRDTLFSRQKTRLVGFCACAYREIFLSVSVPLTTVLQLTDSDSPGTQQRENASSVHRDATKGKCLLSSQGRNEGKMPPQLTGTQRRENASSAEALLTRTLVNGVLIRVPSLPLESLFTHSQLKGPDQQTATERSCS